MNLTHTKEILLFISAIAGGFAGALFAFVFFQLSEQIKSYKQRKTDHFKALSSLQLLLNEYIDKSDKNLQTIHRSNELYKTQKGFLLNYNKLYKYNFDVFVFAGNELAGTVNFSGTSESQELASPVVVLTVILAIIFLVLLVVMIVLITKKPEKTEEFGESYY